MHDSAASPLRVLGYIVAALAVGVVLVAYPILVPSAVAAVVVSIFLRERHPTVGAVDPDEGVVRAETVQLTDENLSRAMHMWARDEPRPPN